MVRVLILFSFLFALAASAAVPAGAPIKSFGGVDASPGPITVPTTDSTYFMLSMYNTSRTADGVYHLYLNGAAYKGGDKSGSGAAHCEAVSSFGSTTSIFFQLFYADNNFTDAAAAGTLTNPKYQAGITAGYPMATAATSYVPRTESIVFDVPNGKYVGIQTQSSAQSYGIKVFCREQ